MHSPGPMTTIKLRTLGSMSLTGPEGEDLSSIRSQPKRFALLVYLALARPRAFHRRDSLLSLFWTDLDEKRARNALSQGLSFLRTNLPEGIILTRGMDEVGLDRERVTTGVEDFESALEDGRWADAVEAYIGDFLQGVNIDDAPGFEEWARAERMRLRREAARAAWSLAQEQSKRGALVEAERNAMKALELGGAEEQPVRRCLESMARAGGPAAAMRLYEAFRRRLHQDLALSPAEDTLALAEAIRNGKFPGRGPEEGIPANAWAEEAPDGSLPRTPSSREQFPVGAAGASGSRKEKGQWRGLWLYALGALVILASLLFLPGRGITPAAPPPIPERPYTVLAGAQGSADARERQAVDFLLQLGLDASQVVHTVPAPEVARTLALMDHPMDLTLDPSEARVVAARLGVPTVVIPHLDRLGDMYSLALRLENASSGHLELAAQGQASRASDVVSLVDSLVLAMRRELGESSDFLAQSQPLPNVLTPSLHALQNYQAARNLNGSGQAQAAVSLLWEAVTLDTAFAMAWQLMAAVYGNSLNQPDSADYARERFLRFPERINEARRADLELHRRMREDVGFWDIGLEEAERAVIRDPDYLNNYAVYTGYEAGRPDSAVNMMFSQLKQVARNARRFDPYRSVTTSCWINTHYWATGMGRVEELFALLDSIRTDLAPDCSREIALFEALAAGEWEKAEELLRSGKGEWRWPQAVEAVSRQLVPLRGQIRMAHGMPDPENAEKGAATRGQWFSIAQLLLEVAYGIPPDHLQENVQAGADFPRALEGRGREEVGAFVVQGVREALVGDTTEARRVLRRLEALREEGTSRTFEAAFEPWFTLMEEGPPFQRGDWASVIEGLEPLGARIQDPGVGFMAGDAFLTWWILAEAHQRSGHTALAIPYLELLLQRPTFGLQDWTLQGFIQPAARYKLAGLYEDVGNPEKAREHYRILLDTFTDPDPDLRWMVEEAGRALSIKPVS